MIVVTLLLLCFDLFTWMKAAVVAMIAVSMFWLPEGIALIMFGMAFLQAKIRDVLDRL